MIVRRYFCALEYWQWISGMLHNLIAYKRKMKESKRKRINRSSLRQFDSFCLSKLPANKIEFSATFATTAGTDPAYLHVEYSNTKIKTYIGLWKTIFKIKVHVNRLYLSMHFVYQPRMKPSFLSVCSKQSLIPVYTFGNVCIFTLTVSSGWLTYTNATPPTHEWKKHNEIVQLNSRWFFILFMRKFKICHESAEKCKNFA